MSFLNPVNDVVKNFKSTDADAPQINYNSRTAGDVKAIFKACLVDGYGSTASAGWTAENDVGSDIHFISPSIAMADYKFIIQSDTASSTVWRYSYKNGVINSAGNYSSVPKGVNYTDKTNPSNGWHLIVSDYGFYFIEDFYHNLAKTVVSRVTFFGSVKRASLNLEGENIGFFCAGYHGTSNNTATFFSTGNSTYRFYRIGSQNNVLFASTNINEAMSNSRDYSDSVIGLTCDAYIHAASGGRLLAKQPAMMIQTIASTTEIYSEKTQVINGDTYKRVFLSDSVSAKEQLENVAVFMLLNTNVWDA